MCQSHTSFQPTTTRHLDTQHHVMGLSKPSSIFLFFFDALNILQGIQSAPSPQDEWSSFPSSPQQDKLPPPSLSIIIHPVFSSPLIKPIPPIPLLNLFFPAMSESKLLIHSSPLSSTVAEAKALFSLVIPTFITFLLIFFRNMISMHFLGRLGSLPLAGGSLAIGFANITGYSVISGMASGMEPLCTQGHGAGRPHLLVLAFRRTVLLLLSISLPISLIWLSMRRILLFCGQDPAIMAVSQSFLHFSLPDLIIQSLIHPIRIYLRSQSITFPITAAAAASAVLHYPIGYLLVSRLSLGVPGVAISSVLTSFNFVVFLLAYLRFSALRHHISAPNEDCIFAMAGWRSLLSLSIPNCVSICLEWWMYEIMVLLCGFLVHPQSTVASMGILIQTTSLIYTFPYSLGAAVSTRVGNELGANRPARAKRAANVGLCFGALLGLAAFLFSFSVRNVWAEIFTADEDIIRLTSSVLPILGLCELGNCPQTTGSGVLRGSARPQTGVNINIGSFYGVGVPVAAGLAFWAGMGFKGLWIGLLSAETMCICLMLVAMNQTDWERQAGRAKSLTKGNGDDDSRLVSVKGVEEGLV